ncbi:hypothetical protein CU098_008511 [Rhizopus stolonifer]|uniref:DUF7082 domain-containing protein n=1 Tax=Rhizopus stolonifer TaxID=4846 RepID=A0A367JGX1_RHIST|nr:hypothetical protein CU098_008511 [Rhizopus stolonifer]
MDQSNKQTSNYDAPSDNNNGFNTYAFSYMDFMQSEIDGSSTEFLRNCGFILPDASFLDTASSSSHVDPLAYQPVMSHDSLPKHLNNSILGQALNLPQRNHRNHAASEPQISLADDILNNFPIGHVVQDIAPVCSSQIPASVPRGTYTVKVFFRPDCMEAKYADWTVAEKLAGRRVVKFNAEVMVSNSEDIVKRIMVDCEPAIDSHLRQCQSNECYISCIRTTYLEDFHITSSDIIRLLECIMSTKFSQEQKTRMRRNIQSLRPSPITRHTHESLFKTITAFTNPVALHTKKEINIFLWSSVQIAISKLSNRFTGS